MELTGAFLAKVLDTPAPAVPRTKQAAPTSGGDTAVFTAAAFAGAVTGLATPAQLRDWYASNPWIFALVNERCEEVATADWVVRPIDASRPYDKGTLDAITTLFESPNPTGRDDSYQVFTHRLAIDTLVLDSGAAQIRTYEDGTPYMLKTLDGARLKAKGGWQDESDGPRYLYMNPDRTDGQPLNNDEVLAIQAHPSSYSLDGLAPLKVLNRILTAEFDTFRSVHILQKNRQPAAILKIPGASPEAIETAKSLWLNELAGRSGLGFMAIPPESDLMVLGSTNLEEQGAFSFYDMLIKAMAAVFRSATLNLNWLEDVNRATSQELANVADDGTIALLKLFQGYFNRRIVRAFPRSDNLGFFFTQLPRDEALSITKVREMAGRIVNPWSINQMLIASGFQPISVDDPEEQEFYDKPLVGVANGQMAPPSTAMGLPQYQAPPAAGAVPPPAGAPANGNKPHPVDQVVGTIPAAASLTKKGTPERDLAKATTDLFDGIDAIFEEAREAARAALHGSS